MRQTEVDNDNKVLFPIVSDLSEYFTVLLSAAAMRLNPDENSMSRKHKIRDIIFKCAHSRLLIVETAQRLTPHLVADCEDLSKQIADFTVKTMMGDNEPCLYEMTAKNAAAKRVKAQKAYGKAVQKMSKINVNSKKMVEQAEKAVQKALAQVKKTVAKAEEAAEKVAKVAQVQSAILRRWREVVNDTAPSDSRSSDNRHLPNCIESCQLYSPTCSRCVSGDCKCT